MEFYLKLADWLESWTCSNSCLSKQTSSLLVIALKSLAMIIKKIFCRKDTCFCWLRGCKVIRLKGEFSQYWQMSGVRFLVSLLEVRNTERILACRSLLKADVDLWQEDLVTENEDIENRYLWSLFVWQQWRGGSRDSWIHSEEITG